MEKYSMQLLIKIDNYNTKKNKNSQLYIKKTEINKINKVIYLVRRTKENT